MKNLGLFALALLVIAQFSFAQKDAFADESSETSLGFGLRLGLGASSYRHHVRLKPSNKDLKLNPAFALSTGLSMQVGLSNWFSISPELQYSLYRANSEQEVKNSNFMSDLYEVGVYMHTLELPVLLRFYLGDAAYVEFGPQVGLNLYSKVYMNEKYYSPDLDLFAFGVAGGGGLNLSGILVGVRVYSGILEYAKDAKGIPWSVQFSITPYLF